MNEFDGRHATDATPHGLPVVSEDGVVFYLEGPASSAFSGSNQVNRAYHFAGGRLKAQPGK